MGSSSPCSRTVQSSPVLAEAPPGVTMEGAADESRHERMRQGMQRAMEEQERHMSWNTGCLWGEPTVQDRSGCQYNELHEAQTTTLRLPTAAERC